MKLRLSLVACLLFAAGCKTDGAESSAGSAAPAAEQPAPKGRSGKIDLPTPRKPSSDGAQPALPDDQDGSADDDLRARREERRKARMAELDKDGDGTISEEERNAARKARVDEMKARLDTDGDGKLSVVELQGSRMARRFGDVATIDTDKNGEISAEELQKSMEDMRTRGWGGRRGGGQWGGSNAPEPPKPAP